MPRKKKKPDYNAEKIMQEFIVAVADAFGEYDDCNKADRSNQSLNSVAAEFGITALKARKLLITAGVYSTGTSRRISELKTAGHSMQQIMEYTGLGRASVHSYLPYTKIPYKLAELSVNAERTKLYRERKAVCEKFANSIAGLKASEQEEELWKTLNLLQGCVFYTAKGLKFTYKIKGGEMFVNRKATRIGDRHYKNCINTNESVTGSASMQDALDNGWKPHPERTNQSTGSVGEIGDRHYKICINK